MAPELVDRLTWPADRLAAHRQQSLRRLLRAAADRSPWHGRRLARINPQHVDEATLSQLPTMTKDDLMEHFDEIVTDRQLSLDLVEAYLEGLTTGGYLLGRYSVIASGGSSGRRGVFVYDRDSWAVYYLGIMRNLLRVRSADPELAGGPAVLATVAAQSPMHATAAVAWTFSGPHLTCLQLPVTLPTDEIVAGLNEAQPAFLRGYASALFSLAEEARAGRLQIRPRRVWTGSEPLSAEVRAALEETWGVPVGNVWGTSEGGGVATPCDVGSSHLSEDLNIVEFVDEYGRPVGPGARAAKVLLTNLFNRTLPLIRYEVTDEVTVLPGRCRCGSAHRRIDDIQGRLEDNFVYGGVRVHAYAFAAPLERLRSIVEYEVRQTPEGAAIAVHSRQPVDLEHLGREITGNLRRLGVDRPEVILTPVRSLERQPSGKLRRFVPLEPA